MGQNSPISLVNNYPFFQVHLEYLIVTDHPDGRRDLCAAALLHTLAFYATAADVAPQETPRSLKPRARSAATFSIFGAE